MKVLDHGYVELVETWGSDERIIEAARMSTQKGFEGWGDFVKCVECGGGGLRFAGFNAQFNDDVFVGCPACDGAGGTGKKGDEKLLRYLWKNNHATPFEMAGAVFEVQAPIFVFREWHRHRSASYNEMSARYAPLPDVNYVPSVERLMMNANGSNKQANRADGAKELTDNFAEWFQGRLETVYSETQSDYETALAFGVPKELARLVLPMGRYSCMRASANLRNWLGFLTLRMDSAAQWEIRQFANAVHDILAEKFPRTLALFDEGK